MTVRDLKRVPSSDDLPGAVLRVFLDANVWVSAILSRRTTEREAVVTRLVHVVSSMWAEEIPLQIVLSHELLDTIDRVLARLGFATDRIADVVGALIDLAAQGPQRRDPNLLVAGRDQIAIHDREDAGILASCFVARADLLITDNLGDFRTKDAERIDTRKVATKDGGSRQLFTLIHERIDDVTLVVMHPVDALSWLESGERPSPSAVRRFYGRSR